MNFIAMRQINVKKYVKSAAINAKDLWDQQNSVEAVRPQ